MRGHLDRILTSTALALVVGLSAPALSQSVSPEEKAIVEGRIPVPDTSLPPPPTAADVVDSTPASTGSVAPSQAPVETPAQIASPSPAADPAPLGPSSAPVAPAPQDTATPAAGTPAVAPSAPAEPVKAAESLPSADQVFADRLRELISARNADRYFARRNERAAAEVFYKERNYAPLWVENNAQSARARAAIAYLQGIDADGLEPSDYPVPVFKSGDVDALAEAELRLTGEILEVARHSWMGRVHYSRISNDIGYEQDAPDPAEILAKVSSAADVAAALASYQPQHPQYKALKAKLAEARGKPTGPAEETVRIPDGQKFKINTDDSRVPLLRKRLKIAGDQNNERYDQDVAEAVRKFQQGSGLNADGIAGPATLRMLNGAPKRERSADIIIANMDRWRWLPRDLGKNYVMVNIPDYRLKLYRDQKLYWETKIVVGKPSQATPITTASMKFITVNPTWNVPPSIIANEYLPAVRQDPGVLERMGLRMEQNRDGTVRIYQPPGDKNALGRIRFNFPNKFLVYQHDTPDKHLFAHDKRAYSHGCMRVENPLMYGEKLLSVVLPNERYSQERLRSMYGPSEVNINFPTHLPVHLTYQTAFVDDAGTLQIREDLYGRDARHIAVFRSEERKVADVATPRSPTGSGITQDQLRYQMRESPFADWFQSRQPQYDRRGNSRVSSGRGEPPFADFFGRMFR